MSTIQNNHTVNCNDCGVAVPLHSIQLPNEKRCHSCGNDSFTYHICLEETAEVKEMLKAQAKDDSRKSKEKLRKEILSGDEIRKSDGAWMKKERIIDKDNDHYLETIIDPVTNEVVHHCDEPLSQHFGHGSAKFRKPESGLDQG